MPYLHGEMDHIFTFRAAPVDVRFVFDLDAGRIVEMDLNLIGSFTPALKDEIADVEQSLKNANHEVFDTPVEYGFERSEAPPAWSKLAAAIPS